MHHCEYRNNSEHGLFLGGYRIPATIIQSAVSVSAILQQRDSDQQSATGLLKVRSARFRISGRCFKCGTARLFEPNASGLHQNEAGVRTEIRSTAFARSTTPSQEQLQTTFTVYKDFSDNNVASVGVSLSCTSGTVTNNPQQASEASPAVFNISGAAADATCTAVENSVPSGYTKNQSDCQNGDAVNGSCTIVNTATSQPEHG